MFVIPLPPARILSFLGQIIDGTCQYAVGLYTADPNIPIPVVVIALVTLAFLSKIMDITVIAWFVDRELRLEREHELSAKVPTDPIADVGKFPIAKRHSDRKSDQKYGIPGILAP